MRGPRILLALGLLMVPMLLAGCAKKKLLAIGDLPPETTLFVQGPVDPVNHVVRLYWFGSDTDGEVVGYELRFKNPEAPADTQWVFTTKTDSTFAVFAPAGLSMPLFEVRAVDDAGQRDPSPAREDFTFTNQAPSVSFTPRLKTTDSTYAVVTLSWVGTDPDGNAGVMRYLVGLDTIPAALHLVTGTTFTIDTTDFKIGGVFPATRPRQAYVRAIDDGGRASGWDSVRWVVREPASPGMHPRLLLVDDVPAETPGNFPTDSIWANTASRNLPPGSFSTLTLEFTQPFRTAKDLAETCRMFDAVVWYRGSLATYSQVMQQYQDGLATYLDGGGKVLFESLHLVDGDNDAGALSNDWTTRYFGSRALIFAGIAGRADSTVAWSIGPGYVDTLGDGSTVVHRSDLHSTVFDDSLREGAIVGGLRGFDVRDTGYVALWARDSSITPRVPRSIPVAVTVPVPESPPGPGRVIAVTVPMRGANGFANIPRFVAKMFAQLGLTGP